MWQMSPDILDTVTGNAMKLSKASFPNISYVGPAH